MTRDNRQILINPHSSQEKVPVGALNLGEIAVQHTQDLEKAALYIETVADSESASTVAKFITDKAIEKMVLSAQTMLQTEIDGINEAVGLPHDPQQWNSGLTVWQAIEQTYEEMTAGTAAASTKLFIDEAGGYNEKYLELRSVTDAASSAINYYIKTKGIDTAIDSAYTILNEKVEELSGATEDVLAALDFTGVTQEGKPVINVTQTDGLVDAETGTIDAQYVTIGSAETPLDEVIEDILEEVEANEVSSSDGSINVTTAATGTDITVNIDGESIVLNDNNELVADLKLSAITPSSVNVREEYALINHNGTQLGDTIKVYKDSSLYSADLGHIDDILSDPTDPESVVEGSGDTALDLIYHKEDGTYELVKINVESFLEESEFADGLQVNNHVVSVKVDPASESVVIDGSGTTAAVLSVGPNGIKVDHIQDAIDAAVADLVGSIDASVTGTSSDGFVTVQVDQEDTELKQVVVTTSGIASEVELDAVENAVGLATGGTHVPTEGYYTSAATTVVGEIAALDSALHEVSEKLDAAEVFETGSTETWVNLTVAETEAGKTGITINDSALTQELIAIRSAITVEAEAREAADSELLGNSASTSADTSIMGLTKLIEELTSETSDNAVQAAEFAAVATKDTTDYGSNAGIAVVDNEGGEGKKIQLDLSLLKVDCGEY